MRAAVHAGNVEHGDALQGGVAEVHDDPVALEEELWNTRLSFYIELEKTRAAVIPTAFVKGDEQVSV